MGTKNDIEKWIEKMPKSLELGKIEVEEIKTDYYILGSPMPSIVNKGFIIHIPIYVKKYD
jgi:hypothetical protein